MGVRQWAAGFKRMLWGPRAHGPVVAVAGDVFEENLGCHGFFAPNRVKVKAVRPFLDFWTLVLGVTLPFLFDFLEGHILREPFTGIQ